MEVDNVDEAVMPGVGLVDMRVRFRDDFGNIQLPHPDKLPPTLTRYGWIHL